MKKLILLSLLSLVYRINFGQTDFAIETTAPGQGANAVTQTTANVGCMYRAVQYITSNTSVHCVGVMWIEASSPNQNGLEYKIQYFLNPPSNCMQSPSSSYYPSDKSANLNWTIQNLNPGTKYLVRSFVFTTLSGNKYVQYGNTIEVTTQALANLAPGTNTINNSSAQNNVCWNAQYILQGSSPAITVNGNTVTPTYKWESKTTSSNWAELPNSNVQSYTIAPTSYTTITQVSYRRVAMANTVSFNSNPAELTFIPSITPVFNYSVVSGSPTVVANAAAFANNGSWLSWSVSTSTVSIPANPPNTITLENKASTYTTPYTLTIKPDGCTAQTATASFPLLTNNIISNSPLTFTATPQSYTTCISETSAGYILYGNDPTGGIAGVSGHAYEWQSSTDNLTWTAIPGGTSKNYSVPVEMFTTSTKMYYRRLAQQAGLKNGILSNTIDVTFNIPVSATLQYTAIGGAPAVVCTPSASKDYSLQWESVQQGNSQYTTIPGATTNTLTLNSDADFRLSITTTGCAMPQMVQVTLPPMTGNAIDTSATQFSGSDIVKNACTAGTLVLYGNVPTGGFPGATFSYQWQSSVDNVEWVKISGATSMNYTVTVSGTMPAAVYYRRQVFQSPIADTLVSINTIKLINILDAGISTSFAWSNDDKLGTFTAQTTPEFAKSYQWQEASVASLPAIIFVNLPGETASTVTINDGMKGFNSFYRVMITPVGCPPLYSETTQMSIQPVTISKGTYSKVWAQYNLNTTVFNDLTPIPPISKTSTGPGYISNGAYGNLYNAFTVTQNVCPVGWAVATYKDWTDLSTAFGGNAIAGQALKSTSSDWKSSTPATAGTNASGLAGEPGGTWSGSSGTNEKVGEYARFWTYTTTPPAIYLVTLTYNAKNIAITTSLPADYTHGAAIRCIKK